MVLHAGEGDAVLPDANDAGDDADLQALCFQFVALFVPARYYMNIARGIFLKGLGASALWFELVLMVFYCVSVCYFTTRKLRQKVA